MKRQDRPNDCNGMHSFYEHTMRGRDFQGECSRNVREIIKIIACFVISIAISNMAILYATDYPEIMGPLLMGGVGGPEIGQCSSGVSF
jgi:hypothetical protein